MILKGLNNELSVILWKFSPRKIEEVAEVETKDFSFTSVFNSEDLSELCEEVICWNGLKSCEESASLANAFS